MKPRLPVYVFVDINEAAGADEGREYGGIKKDVGVIEVKDVVDFKVVVGKLFKDETVGQGVDGFGAPAEDGPIPQPYLRRDSNSHIPILIF